MAAPLQICMGFDRREKLAYGVAEFSFKRRSSVPLNIIPLKAGDLHEAGLLRRTVAILDNGQMWDVISEAPQSTEFAISRFLTPHLVKTGWALFCDCDVVCLTDIARLFDLVDNQYAVMCVKHQYAPKPGVKMDAQTQTMYNRKNWSSVMLFNCDHPSNKALTVETINSLPGRDLHSFCWLKESEIGALDTSWNCLVGEDGYNIDYANIAHFTLGGPWFQNHERKYGDEVWLSEYKDYMSHMDRETNFCHKKEGF